MTRAGWIAAVALTIAGSVGCRGLPTTHYYLLEPQDVAIRPAATTGLSIGVAPFHVDPPYDQDRIVYRIGTESAEVGYYAYHRWASPLSRMLPRVVAGAFGAVSGISFIEPSATGRDYDAILHGRVIAIEEVDSTEGAGVHLRLTLSLLSLDGAELWSQTLISPSTARTVDHVSQIVTHMRATLNEMLDESSSSLGRTLPELSRRLDSTTGQFE